MDILSIIALGKANKALKNGGGAGGLVYYEFSIENDGGNPVLESEATVEEILSDIANGKMPVAIIKDNFNNGNDMFAYMREYADDNVFFATMPFEVSGALKCNVISYNSGTSSWEEAVIPEGIA